MSEKLIFTGTAANGVIYEVLSSGRGKTFHHFARFSAHGVEITSRTFVGAEGLPSAEGLPFALISAHDIASQITPERIREAVATERDFAEKKKVEMAELAAKYETEANRLSKVLAQLDAQKSEASK